jgi:hypothetical protein
MLTIMTLPFINCPGPSDQQAGTPYSTYSYYYFESTGANKFILIDGVLCKIEFDPDTSNAAAIEALLSLKWNILYPNSKGGITLFGIYHKDKETFSLLHWQLPEPIKAYTGTVTSAPGELVIRDALVASDFDKDIRGNPHIYNSPPEANP